MEPRFKEQINPKKFIIILAALTALFGISMVLISDFLIIPFAAFYALLLWFAPQNKLLCALLPLAVLAFSIINGVMGIFSVSAGLCCGLLLCFMYRRRCTKLDTALALTAFFTFYLLLSLFLSIGYITKDYSLTSVITYYEEFVETQKTTFVDTFSQLHVVNENGESTYLFTEADAEGMFLSAMRLTISFFVISAFLLCGITCKIFSKMVVHAERNETYVRSWRFLLPNLYVYFYIALFAFSFFAGIGDSVFNITVQNLYYIFMVIFAYIGIRHLFLIVSRARRKGPVILIIVGLFLFFSVSAIQILSFLGAYATIVSNRVLKE